MEDMFYAIIGLAFIITLAVLAQKRRNKHFNKGNTSNTKR